MEKRQKGDGVEVDKVAIFRQQSLALRIFIKPLLCLVRHLKRSFLVLRASSQPVIYLCALS